MNGEKILSGTGTTYLSTLEDIMPKLFASPPKKVMKLVGQAVKEWNMIEDGDRLLLGLSGGKDSLALLHILVALQKRAPVRFEIACATVDPQTESFDPSPLIPYVKSLGITYHYLSEPIVELAKTKLQVLLLVVLLLVLLLLLLLFFLIFNYYYQYLYPY